jgi:hypothetical protein
MDFEKAFEMEEINNDSEGNRCRLEENGGGVDDYIIMYEGEEEKCSFGVPERKE